MASTYYFSAPSKLLNNFTDEEKLDLTNEDLDALDRLFDQHLDAQEYSYFFATSKEQIELRF